MRCRLNLVKFIRVHFSLTCYSMHFDAYCANLRCRYYRPHPLGGLQLCPFGQRRKRATLPTPLFVPYNHWFVKDTKRKRVELLAGYPSRSVDPSVRHSDVLQPHRRSNRKQMVPLMKDQLAQLSASGCQTPLQLRLSTHFDEFLLAALRSIQLATEMPQHNTATVVQVNTRQLIAAAHIMPRL